MQKQQVSKDPNPQKKAYTVFSFRLTELVAKGDGVAILDANMSFGGGTLCNFGINSNTSANGFIKCLYKRWEINQASRAAQSQSPNVHKSKAAAETVSPDGSPVRKKLKEKNCGLEEDDSEEGDMVEEDEVY